MREVSGVLPCARWSLRHEAGHVAREGFDAVLVRVLSAYRKNRLLQPSEQVHWLRAQASGAFQVFETDRVSWRRELLQAPDGQVLMVRPDAEDGAS